ncbi:MAG: excalibur calcium-binding domain-containing protein [Proteobacteria bacterium]|nr:excalibur calcium-binding domain-containing protein [Pseudomonadota bacterium]
MSALPGKLRPWMAEIGLVRKRLPQQGDRWSGCDPARAAGTAPIYSGEPGYRAGLDGDGDGIACEPKRGSLGLRRWGRRKP